MSGSSTHPPTPGVLLAGGLGRRMGGGDKPLCAIAGRSLLARAIARLAPQCDALVLNGNGDATRFANFGLPVIADAVPEFAGPLAGILAGLEWITVHRPSAAWMLSAPTDCPFLPENLVARLHAARDRSDARIVVAASGGRTHHVVALWSVSLRHDLRRALIDEGFRAVGGFIARYPSVTAQWPVTPYDPFFNANTIADLETAERMLNEEPSL